MTSRGFTVLETLLSLALLTILSAGVLGFVASIAERRERVTIASDDMAAADAIFERLDADILTVFAGGAGMGAGLSGDDHSITLTSRQAFFAASGEAGAELYRTSIHWDKSSGVIRGEHSATTDASGLGTTELTSRGERMAVRYNDGEAWRDRFDSLEAGKLPLAVEVAIWFGEIETEDPEGDAESFEMDEPITLDDLIESDFGDAELRAPDRVRVFAIPGSPRFGSRGEE